MGINHFLFKVSPAFLKIPPGQRVSQLNEEYVRPFGSQANIIECLCDVPGFERDVQADEAYLTLQQKSERQGLTILSQPLLPMVTFTYHYPHTTDCGRAITYRLQDDPVTCFATNHAYREDFWPLIHALGDFTCFLVFNPRGEFTNPADFRNSFKTWMRKNYEDDDLSLS